MKSIIQFYRLFALIAAVGLLLIGAEARGQEEIEDLIWLKQTGQLNGFYQVKFSKNGHLIAGHGMSDVLFFDTETGEEIIRIPGNNEVFFINNDENYIQLNEDHLTIEVYDTETFSVIDTIDSDGISIKGMQISRDHSLMACEIEDGIAFLDLSTEDIIGSIEFSEKQDFYDRRVTSFWFDCDNSKLLVGMKVRYKTNDPQNPLRSELEVSSFNLSDYLFEQTFNDYSTARISNDCSKIAMRNPNSTLDILNFQTRELIHSLPINGMSITGYEFSPDDNYLVTTQGSSANPGSVMLIWDMNTGMQVHRYPGGAYNVMDLSSDKKYIVTSTAYYLFLWDAKYGTSPVEEGVIKAAFPYPNPTNDILNIELESKAQDIKDIQILNSNGALVKQFSIDDVINDATLELNTNDLPNGSYLAVVQTKSKKYTYQFIINK